MDLTRETRGERSLSEMHGKTCAGRDQQVAGVAKRFRFTLRLSQLTPQFEREQCARSTDNYDSTQPCGKLALSR